MPGAGQSRGAVCLVVWSIKFVLPVKISLTAYKLDLPKRRLEILQKTDRIDFWENNLDERGKKMGKNLGRIGAKNVWEG